MDTIPQDDVPRKRCNRCRQSLPFAAFQRDSSKKDGLRTICTECVKNPSPCLALKPDASKQCSACHQTKPVSDFSRRKDSPSGYKSACKECNGKRENERIAHRTLRTVSDKQCCTCQKWLPATTDHFFADKTKADGFHPKCKGCAQVYHESYRKLHREGLVAYSRRYYRSHKEEHRQRNKEYERKNEERTRAYQQRYYQEHRTRKLLYGSAYYKTERGKEVSAAAHKERRARKKGAPGELTSLQIRAKLKAQRYRCYYGDCGFAKFEKKDGKYIFELDHVISLSRPEHGPRHDVNFTVLACPTCNRRKHNKLPHEWEGSGRLF